LTTAAMAPCTRSLMEIICLNKIRVKDNPGALCVVSLFQTTVMEIHHRHPLIVSIILLNSILFSGMHLEILADEDWRSM